MKARIGTATAETLVRVNKWLDSIQAGRTYSSYGVAPTNTDLVEKIASDLIVAKARGTERKLLSKSLQEAMYYAVRFEPNLDFDEAIARLTRYVNRRGNRLFIRRFLSLFFYNFIHFHQGESFRASARNSAEFEKYSENIDFLCRQTVASVWKSFEKTKRPLDLRAARKLVSDIDQRLREI